MQILPWHWNILVNFRDHSKCHWLTEKLNWSLDGRTCILSVPDVANVGNDGTYSNNIILVIKDTKLYVPVPLHQQKKSETIKTS